MSLLKKKRIEEKRRRNQIYIKLNYLVNMINFSDFFSTDLLNLFSITNYLNEFFKNQTTNCLNTLIFAFFKFPNSAKEIITKKTNLKYIDYLKLTSKNISNQEISLYLKNRKDLNKTYSFYFSKDLQELFKLAADFTFNSLKIPVISTKIFFLYLLDYLYFLDYPFDFFENSTNRLKFLTQRFCFLKEIYKEEIYIQKTLERNQVYFAYLLKIYLSDFEFNQLKKLNLLKFAVNHFRNILISNSSKINIFKILNTDINTTIKLNSKRIYSL